MTGEDLAKLLEADYTKTENDDGSYTLTKSIRTSAGEQTVYITVTGNKATRTVDTTLKVDVKKSEHTGSAEVKQDDVMLPNKTDKTLTFTDKNSNTFNVDLDELLQKPDKTESTNAAGDKVITVKDGSKTYEIIYHETNEYTDAQVKDLSADELAGLLNSNSANGEFIVKDSGCQILLPEWILRQRFHDVFPDHRLQWMESCADPVCCHFVIPAMHSSLNRRNLHQYEI